MTELTILTTTYNRGYLLSNCYKSLCDQTCKDFEWLIIDDGSTDNTEAIVEKLKMENPLFQIQYVKKENGGKHTALNYSHPYIRGKYLLMLDDDDILMPDAVKIALNDWKIYEADSKIGCISYQKGKVDTKLPLVDWSGKDPIISNTIDFRINANRRGDCAEVIRTEMFKKYPAPTFENEKFLAEDFLWINSAFEYDTVYIKKVIYLCEYRNDGLTKNKNANRLKNPQGGMYTCNLYFNSRIAFIVQVKKAILYDCYALSTNELIQYLKHAKSFSKCMLSLPVAWIVYKTWLK